MTIATKNDRIVLKTGRIAQNCACCVLPPCEIDYRDVVRATVVISGGQDAYLQWNQVYERVTFKKSKVTYGSTLNGTYVFENFVPVGGAPTLLRSTIPINDPSTCTALHNVSFTVGNSGRWIITVRNIPSLLFTDREPAAGVDTSDGTGNESLITPSFQYYGIGISCTNIDNRVYVEGVRNPAFRPGANCSIGGANFVFADRCFALDPVLPIPPAVLRGAIPHIISCTASNLLSSFLRGNFLSGSLHDAGGWSITPTTFEQIGTERLEYSIDSVEFEF